MNIAKPEGNFPTQMNVVQIIDSLGTGGAEHMVLLLARECERVGARFSVISLADDTDSDIAREIQAINGRVFHFPAGKLLDPRRILSIARFLRKERFDLVQAYLTYANIVGSLSGMLAGIPVICSLRNVDEPPEHYHPGRRFLETICLNLLARRVMGNGYAIAKAHSRRVITKKIDVIPNAAIVPDKISSVERKDYRKKLALDATQPVAVSVGRLIHQKGYSHLIASLARVREKIPAMVLVIAGEGNERENLERQIERLGLTNNVQLIGYRHDIQSLLQACDMFVSSSLFEGMSVAILEAMAAGLPVIATDVGDASRVVDDKTGILIPNPEPELIAGSILSILADREKALEMGSAGRKRVIEDYSPEAWLKSIGQLYKTTVGWKTTNGE
jgi:glycosyltransferase involved in cell wall biosynthesis